MTNSPAWVLVQLLINAGLGSDVRNNDVWPIYRYKMPDTGAKDDAICVYNTTSVLDGRDHRSGAMIEHPGIQIRIRSLDHDDGWAKGQAIQDYLDQNVRNTTVAVENVEYNIASFNRTTSLMFIGEEEESLRQLFTINGTLTVREL